MLIYIINITDKYFHNHFYEIHTRYCLDHGGYTALENQENARYTGTYFRTFE